MIFRSLLIVVFGAAGIFGNAQNWKFLRCVEETASIGYDENPAAGQTQLDVPDFDRGYYSGMLIEAINRERIQKNQKPFLQDSILNRIAYASMESFNRRNFANKRTWAHESISILYALRRIRSGYKIYEAYAFTVDLADLKQGARYYLNRRIGESDLNLYHGKNPKIHDPEHEDYVEPVPVKTVGEQEFCNRTIDWLVKNDAEEPLKSPTFSAIGLNVKVDRTSLNSGVRRPKAFVVIIFAGKITQHISVPADTFGEQENDWQD